MTEHGLRKYFSTSLETEGASPVSMELLLGLDLGLKSIYSKPTATQLVEGNGLLLGHLHGISTLTINEDNRLRKQVTVQLVESNRQDQKPKEQIERILNVILNDQEQVRAIGASPYFKKKLQEGKSKNKFHRVNILGSELSQGICSVCQRVCDQQCGECMKYFCEVHIKEHASAHR